MKIIRFRSNSEHEDILKKVKKMKKFASDLEECLEDMIEEDDDFDYREEYDDDDYESKMKTPKSRLRRMMKRGY